MIDNETVRKASEIGIIDVVDAIKLIETNPAYITLTFDEKINMVIDFVYQQRYNETVRRLKKSAKLRYVDADLRDIHYTDNRSITHQLISSLATCNYITLKTNIIIHGPCGTGKTWLSCALANEAAKQKYKIFYIRMPELLEKYNELRNMGKSLSQVVKKYAKYDLLVLDEWLMYEMTDKEKQFISELMEIRHDKCSTIFCSQYPSGDWYDKLHKSTLTEALGGQPLHGRDLLPHGLHEQLRPPVPGEGRLRGLHGGEVLQPGARELGKLLRGVEGRQPLRHLPIQRRQQGEPREVDHRRHD